MTGLYTLVIEPELSTLSLTRATLTRGDTAPVTIEAVDVVVEAGGLGVCPRPSAGRIDLERDGEEAFAEFDESTADDGAFSVTLDDLTVGEAVLDCQPEAPPGDDDDDE